MERKIFQSFNYKPSFIYHLCSSLPSIAETKKSEDLTHQKVKINLNFLAEKHNIMTLKRLKHKKKSMLKNLIVLPLIFLIDNSAISAVYLYRTSHMIIIHTIKNRL
jgi:hypothetical protein